MNACGHEELRLDNANRYACDSCGSFFVVESVEPELDQPAQPERRPAAEPVDVSGRIRFYADARKAALPPAATRRRKKR